MYIRLTTWGQDKTQTCYVLWVSSEHRWKDFKQRVKK